METQVKCPVCDSPLERVHKLVGTREQRPFDRCPQCKVLYCVTLPESAEKEAHEKA